MTAPGTLLFLLGDDGGLREWLLLRNGAIAERSPSVEAASERIAPAELSALEVVLAVPGSLVAVHWLELPDDLSHAQRLAAARIAVAGIAAQPAETLHVAVGRKAEDSASVPIALADAERMEGWISRLRDSGFDPDVVLPQPFLLPAPAEGFVCCNGTADLPLYRGPADAFSLEPHLASHIIGGTPLTQLDRDRFEQGIPGQAADPLINLRQGRFAKRRTWAVEKDRLRRLMLLGAAVLLMALVVPLAATLRYTLAADALETELGRVAAEALGRDAVVADPGLQIERRVAELGGSGVEFDRLAAGLFAAVRSTPNAELVSLDYDGRGSLRATVEADVPATLDALRRRLEATGLAAAAGPLQDAGGQARAELSVTAR